MSPSTTIPPLPPTIASQLPRIEWLAQQAVVAQARAHEATLRLADLGRPSPPPPFSPVPLVAEIQEELLLWEERALKAWNEIRRLGGHVTDREIGFVDFPVDGADGLVMLCWQLGEKNVEHWHLPDEPCCERRPIELMGSQGEGSAVS